MITSDDYYKVTGCVDVGGFRLPSFTIEEVQHFLIKKGYEIIIHKAPAKLEITKSEFGTGEVNRTGNFVEKPTEVILAIKPGDVLPSRVDSKEAEDMNFLNVFKKEMVNKLIWTTW